MDTAMVHSVSIRVDHVVPDEAEALRAVKERLAKVRSRQDSHASMAAAAASKKIHQFPRVLRGIGGPDGQYTVPTVVAIGPYHHGQPHLQDMEELKLTMANDLFADLKNGFVVDDVYGKLLSVVGKARDCYDDDDKVRRFSDGEFAAMMLLDGCFLLRFMVNNRESSSFQCRTLSSEYCILKDMMVLENQIPWLVLEVLMEFLPVDYHDVRRFVANVANMFFPKKEDKSWWSRKTACLEISQDMPVSDRDITDDGHQRYETYSPAHLLSLLRHSQIWKMPKREMEYKAGNSSLLSSSAVKLAQIGVKLSASMAPWFGDVSVGKRGICGVFSLSPVFLNDVTACWLVNMAALEATSTTGACYGEFVVSSYLSALAMLMDREEDVQQLRGHRVVLSTFSNTQTLDFSKCISQHLRFGGRYFVILEQIESYRRNRPVRIKVYKFVYNHYRAIAAILSIVGVLVGIFKALTLRT